MTSIDTARLGEAFALSRAASDLAHAARDLIDPARTDERLAVAETLLKAASAVQDVATTVIETHFHDQDNDPGPTPATALDSAEPF
ncbi:hypothetical protein [Pseudofrankia sp. BMG5.36]|uniref:hypothetical protein n=1 Tax=Pseudofrankia sp. BMG5.36 TaxID=1834512 RepID=UPI0008D93DB2|nr:hypothetical protein [Pseudofrankia sp. BMG5.36]OHV53556.1 hypothetical protein BCD48_44715 [Pseudofrankia sp. BMG5.36]